MSALLDIFRATFPHTLRFDRASMLLYAQCYALSRRLRHRRYIPREDIEHILNAYITMPGPAWLRWPVLNALLPLGLINGLRCRLGRKSWLYNQNVATEHAKIVRWLAAQQQRQRQREQQELQRTNGSHSCGEPGGDATTVSAARRPSSMIEREKFEREVLGEFHVATMYQRVARFGGLLLVVILCLLYAAMNVDAVLALLVKYVWRMPREEVLAWFRAITAQHTRAEVPPAYKALLPPPCVPCVTARGGVEGYAVNVVELHCAARGVTVLAVPCPLMGTRDFFAKVGALARECDAVLLEGVSVAQLDRLVPGFFLPFKRDSFAALGVHHRFIDLLRDAKEPPLLYPAGRELGGVARWAQAFVPFEVRCVYRPTAYNATLGEARVGWGWLYDFVERAVAERGERAAAAKEAGGAGAAAPFFICVPWTVQQIASLEASLVKAGFEVTRVFPLWWLARDHLGRHFCERFAIA